MRNCGSQERRKKRVWSRYNRVVRDIKLVVIFHNIYSIICEAQRVAPKNTVQCLTGYSGCSHTSPSSKIKL